jgi:phage-related protein
MADWHAIVPPSEPWIVGSSVLAHTRPYRSRHFCEREGKMVLLHAFIKKTQKTPAADLELAIKRKKEIA